MESEAGVSGGIVCCYKLLISFCWNTGSQSRTSYLMHTVTCAGSSVGLPEQENPHFSVRMNVAKVVLILKDYTENVMLYFVLNVVVIGLPTTVVGCEAGQHVLVPRSSNTMFCRTSLHPILMHKTSAAILDAQSYCPGRHFTTNGSHSQVVQY